MKFLIFLSEAMVPLMIFYIVGFGLLSGRPVLDDFIDGAKDGMKTVAGILPTLVGLMVSVGVSGHPVFWISLGKCLWPLRPDPSSSADRTCHTGAPGFQLRGNRIGAGYF